MRSRVQQHQTASHKVKQFRGSRIQFIQRAPVSFLARTASGERVRPSPNGADRKVQNWPVSLHMKGKIYVDNTKTNTPVTHVSLCAGYGGIDIGLKRAIPNLRTIAFSEIEAFACANLVSKMEQGALDPAPIWTNLKTFPWGQFRGCVDILSGGFPCQPFSQAGKRVGDEDPRHLFPYILAGIKICRPAAVFLENVEGLVSAKLAGEGWADPAGTPVLLHVVRELERAGYDCAWGIFSASEVGAPHRRKRVFILGLEHSASFHGGGLPLRAEPAQPFPGVPSDTGLAHSGLLGPKVKGLSAARIVESGGGLAEGPGSGTRPHFKGQRPRPCGIGAGQEAERWPARPGQPQYEWEAPRVVASKAIKLVDTDCGGLEGAEKGRRHGADAVRPSHKVSGKRPTQSALGGKPHGPAAWLDATVSVDSRVDELRLLGNGVVPATAARAFSVLFGRLTAGTASTEAVFKRVA